MIDAALVLVGLLTILNSVAVIVLIRQVGLLHLRIQPVEGLQSEDGPSIGDHISFESVDWTHIGALVPRAERVVLAFISPTCSICAPLLPGLRSISRTFRAEALVVVSDTDSGRLREYLDGKRLNAPAVAEPGAFRENRVPGAPWIVVTDPVGEILASRGVNTFEQIELLVAEAASRHRARDSSPNGNPQMEVRLNVP